MESAMENITELESERVEQTTAKEIETEEQRQDTVLETDKGIDTEEQRQDIVMETDNKNPGEEDLASEHKDSTSPMITEKGISHVSILEKGTNDDDLPKIDDEKNSQLETNPHPSPTPEEGFIKPTVEDTVQQNIGSSEVSSGDRDLVMIDKDSAVVHEETTTVPHNKLSEEKGSLHHHSNTAMEQNKDTEEHDMASTGDHNNIVVTPNIKLSEEKGSPLHHANAVMEQDKPAEEHDMASSGDHNEITVTTETEISEDKESPLHHVDTVMGHDKAAEEHDMLSSGDHNEFPVNTETKAVEENNDRLDEGDINLADHGSEQVYHDQGTTKEDEKGPEELGLETLSSLEKKPSEHLIETLLNVEKGTEEPGSESLSNLENKPSELLIETSLNVEKGPEVPVSETESNLENKLFEPLIATYGNVEKEPEEPGSETLSNQENKPSEPLIETSVKVEKEPDMPTTEILTENYQNSDVLAVVVSGDSDKGLPLLPATQTSSDHNEGVATLETERMEDMELDVPDSMLVTDASIDPSNNNDVNVEAPTNAENKDYSIVLVPEENDADDESASVRREPGPPYVPSSDTKSEVEVSGVVNNGVHKVSPTPPGLDRPMSPKRSFLLDDTLEGNESGTEEDQSAFTKELDHFFRERNMDFKPPKFYGEGLNCLKLWRAVIRLGGYDKVTGFKLWRQVGESFRPPKTCTTVSWTFRGFYEKTLLEYERHKVMSGEIQIPLATEPEPMNVDNQASGLGRARRDAAAAARAMQGWHSQRLNGNSEADDPAIKDKNSVLHQKRDRPIGTSPGLLKRKRPSSTEHIAKHAIQVSRPMLDVTVVDVGPPADWVKVNVQRTQNCFEVYALVPGLVREEVRVQSDPAGRLVISGEPENPMNPWGATPFKKVVSLPTRIDPHHTSAVVTLNGQLFVRVPLEQSD